MEFQPGPGCLTPLISLTKMEVQKKVNRKITEKGNLKEMLETLPKMSTRKFRTSIRYKKKVAK